MVKATLVAGIGTGSPGAAHNFVISATFMTRMAPFASSIGSNDCWRG